MNSFNPINLFIVLGELPLEVPVEIPQILRAAPVDTVHVLLALAPVRAYLERLALVHERLLHLLLLLGHELAVVGCAGVCLLVSQARLLVARHYATVDFSLKQR